MEIDKTQLMKTMADVSLLALEDWAYAESTIQRRELEEKLDRTPTEEIFLLQGAVKILGEMMTNALAKRDHLFLRGT